MSEIAYITTAGVCADCQGNCQPDRLVCSKCAKARKAAGTRPRVTPADAEFTAQVVAEQPWSPYRCRAHHDSVVTAKGKGCTQCPRVKR